MSNFVFNIAKGRVAYYATLPNNNDAIIAVPLQTSTLESDSLLMQRESLEEILTVSTEQTTMGRKILSNIESNVVHAENKVFTDANDFTYTGASGAAIGAFIICYEPDTTNPNDAAIIPLTKHDFSALPNGGDIPVQISGAGFFVATSNS